MKEHALPTSFGGRIGVIDGLRGWAILIIIAAHVYVGPMKQQWFHLYPAGFGLHLSPLGFFLNMNEAVTLFFVLSGCVLTLPYFQERRKMETINDVWAFVRRRSRRLLPLYCFAFLWFATFTSGALAPGPSFISVLEMGTLTRHFFHPFLFTPFDGVLWSLEVEWWCSLIIPFLLLALHRWSMRRILVIAILISLLSRILLTYHLVDDGTLRPYLSLNTVPSRLDAFVWGMAIAWLFCKKRDILFPYRYLFFTGAFVLLFPGFIIMQLVFQDELSYLVGSFACLIITAGLGLGTLSLLLMAQEYAVRFFFLNSPIRLCGRMCYSLYIWHFPAIASLQPLLTIYHFIRYLCLLSYRFIECAPGMFRRTQDEAGTLSI
jgi:peptidoglycan/LPS O-acetylase OafA/YrhL